MVVDSQFAHEGIGLQEIEPSEVELAVWPASQDEFKALQDTAVSANGKRLMAGMMKTREGLDDWHRGVDVRDGLEPVFVLERALDSICGPGEKESRAENP